ncbi:hypothetical protein D3C71_1164480 [compost metagenome]
MDTEKLEHIRRLVKNDDKYGSFKKSVEKNPNLKLPFDDLHEELERMQKTRSIRSLNRRDKRFTEAVLDAKLLDQQYRSRCTEILGSTIPITGAFQDTLTNLRDYLLLQYGKRIGGTKNERQQFMENVLRPFFKRIHKVEQLKEHCRFIVDDIDKAGYTFNNLIELIKLLGKPESL